MSSPRPADRSGSDLTGSAPGADLTGSAPGADLTGPIVGFVRTLRAAGVDASHERLHAFVVALDELGASDRTGVYWAGRLTLCADPDDLARYERVFAAFFVGGSVTSRARTRRRVTLAPDAVGTDAGDADAGTGEEAPQLRAVVREASAREVLRHRDVADLDDAERAQLHRLLAAFRLPGEARRTRRHQPASRGGVDRRRTVRAMLAAGGEAGPLVHRAPRRRPRPVVLLVDISGSMVGYADVLLRFAHAASRSQPRSGGAPRPGGRTEVFTLGTRTTRVTEALTHRDPDTAMRAVGRAVPDWSGGTRLGETLATFLDRWGQRGAARGAVAVVLSDGWETGDVDELEAQVARLARLTHRLVWANPRAGRPGFAPTAAGMAAALPYCDQLVEGHSLAALEHLAAVVVGAPHAATADAHHAATAGAGAHVPAGGQRDDRPRRTVAGDPSPGGASRA